MLTHLIIEDFCDTATRFVSSAPDCNFSTPHASPAERRQQSIVLSWYCCIALSTMGLQQSCVTFATCCVSQPEPPLHCLLSQPSLRPLIIFLFLVIVFDSIDRPVNISHVGRVKIVLCIHHNLLVISAIRNKWHHYNTWKLPTQDHHLFWSSSLE